MSIIVLLLQNSYMYGQIRQDDKNNRFKVGMAS